MRSFTASPSSALLWLGCAIIAHCLVALLAVLCRWLQIRPSPIIPALRLALMVNLLGLAALVGSWAAVLAATWLLRCWACARQHTLASRAEPTKPTRPSTDAAKTGPAGITGGGVSGSTGSELPAARGDDGGPYATAAAMHARDGGAELQFDHRSTGAGACLRTCSPEAEHKQTTEQQQEQCQQQQQQNLKDARQQQHRAVASDVPLLRGLSARVQRLERQRPALVRASALGVLAGTYAVGAACQIAAAGLVDAAIVQLVLAFTVLGVALVQRLLLRLRLPPFIYPCAAAMLGGACMILVPTLGQSSSGGLNSGRGWLGFALALVTLLATVVNFVALQASSGLKFTSMRLQAYYLALSVALLLPLSLGIDGADWAAQFSGWGAGDWAVLALTSTVVYIGCNAALQNATWELGAPTVSLFFGVRLIAATLAQKLILSVTVVTSGLQIAGVCVTVLAVSAFMFQQWRQSRWQAAGGG